MSTRPQGRIDTVPAHQPNPVTLRKATIGATIGSVVEWFDVAVYAYLATTIAKVFFPKSDPGAQLMSTFALFGIAFLVRPLGGIFFGHLGDKIGRQKTLAWVLLLVSGATVLIGLLPGHATIGVAAPALLAALRLLQGFSAGGEMGGASAFVAEHAPPRRRGFLVGWVEMGCILGFLLGSVVVLVIGLLTTDEQMLAWGWRVPFLLAAPLGIVGLYIRNKLEETPEFLALQKKKQVSRSPLVETITKHWRSILRVAAYSLFQNAALYVILTFIPTHLKSNLNRSATLSTAAAVVAMTAICILIPLWGALSDRIGRRPVLAASCILMAIFAYPLFLLMAQGATAALISYLLLGIILSIFLGVTLSAMNEMFTARVRMGGFSIGYNLSVSLFGGTAPYLMQALVNNTENLASPAFYLIAAALVTLPVILLTKETAPRKVEHLVATGRLDPAAGAQR